MKIVLEPSVSQNLPKEINSLEFRNFLTQNLKNFLWEWNLQNSRKEAEKIPKSELLNL